MCESPQSVTVTSLAQTALGLEFFSKVLITTLQNRVGLALRGVNKLCITDSEWLYRCCHLPYKVEIIDRHNPCPDTSLGKDLRVLVR